MAKRRAVSNKQAAKKEIGWNPGDMNPKQIEFCQSRTFYTCYGGAKGGGKSHVVRKKAIGAALIQYPGIRILIMRKKYPDLEQNHIQPICNEVPVEVASYNGTNHIMTFTNGSTIRFGHWQGDMSEDEYNGQEYDWIFIDEATQFSERSFNFLCGCVRGVNDIPKRMYLTCNPGGVGHRWVKRLFIDKDYITDSDDPEKNENPADYTFIFATVDDNQIFMRKNPNYVKQLAKMPNAQAYRYGDWDAIGGNYFPEFRLDVHTCTPFPIPSHWPRYRVFDYGLDMLACYWVAVDETGRSCVYREYCEKNLVIRDAAKAIRDRTMPGETILTTYAPDDIWARQKESGKTMAQLFLENGVPLTKASRNRVQGHMLVKDALALRPDGKPGIIFFNTCTNIMADIRDIQADEKNPDDCAIDPHDVTHTVDAIRYYCISRTMEAVRVAEEADDDYAEDALEDYEDFMTGGEVSNSYITYGGHI